MEHVSYNALDASYGTDVFTDPKLKGSFANAVSTPNKHIYSPVIADSNSNAERNLANALKIADEVAVYAKLPRGFHFSAPVGNYNPDWAIAFNEGSVKYIYFVAEIKGNLQTLELELRNVEKAKISAQKVNWTERSIKRSKVRN